jgi:predicted nucleic acid-binding protein
MIVTDTNILTSLFFPATSSAVVEKLQKKTEDWIVPPIWRSEFIDVAAAYFRKGIISYDQALEAVSQAAKILEDAEMEPDILITMSMIKNSKCTPYDCQFVALAFQMNVRLLTLDPQILIEFPAIAIKPQDYLAQH